MAKKISKTKGLVCVSLVFVLSRRNEKAVRDFSEVFCFLFFYFFCVDVPFAFFDEYATFWLVYPAPATEIVTYAKSSRGMLMQRQCFETARGLLPHIR